MFCPPPHHCVDRYPRSSRATCTTLPTTIHRAYCNGTALPVAANIATLRCRTSPLALTTTATPSRGLASWCPAVVTRTATPAAVILSRARYAKCPSPDQDGSLALTCTHMCNVTLPVHSFSSVSADTPSTTRCARRVAPCLKKRASPSSTSPRHRRPPLTWTWRRPPSRA